MEHRIAQRASFVVTGMQIRCVPGPTVGVEVPRLWDAFIPQMCDVPGRVGEVSFGVCQMLPGPDGAVAAGPGPFVYTAGVETSADAPVPAGMVRVVVPAGKYAVFTYRGPISRFAEAVEEVWRRALPSLGLKPTGGPDFEEYGVDFNPEHGPVGVWAPIV